MIRKLKMTNWKSHLQTEVNFERGTNVMVGRMGSGKSSVLQALSFGLFGEIPEIRSRKLSLGALIMRRPKQADKAEIEVEFEVDGLIYTVRRTIGDGHGDAELYKEGRLWEQGITRVTGQVQELLGIDFPTFTQVVYARQNEIDHFLRIGKGDRTSLIDGLLKIDKMTDARSNLLSLRRSQEGRLSDLRLLAKEGTENLDEKIEQLSQELINKQEELKQLKLHLDELGHNKAILHTSEGEMEKSRNLLESLERKKESTTGKLQILEGHLKKLPNIKDADKKLEELELELSTNRKKVLDLRTELTSNERELRELKEKQRKIKSAELTLSKTVEDFSDKLAEIVESIGLVEVEIKSREDALKQLTTTTAKCPVCEHLISDPKKHIEQHRKKVKVLIAKQESLRTILETLRGKQKNSEKLQLEIKSAQTVVADKKKIEDKLKQLESINLSPEVEKLKLKIVEQEQQQLKLRDAAERELVLLQVDTINKEARLITSKLTAVHYNKLEHKTLKENLRAVVEEFSRIRTKATMLPESIHDKQTLISELSGKREKILDAKTLVEKSEVAMEALKILSNALIDVQIVVRKKFVEVVNELLSDVWIKLYPYGDYDGLRIFVEEDGRRAGDYVLQIHEAGGWVNVDGVASGGERSMASLSLRVAFARALSRMGTLLLDEPTHNLDSEGIQKLIEVLKEGMPEVLDQVVLITHESDMEQAATGLSYRLMREANQATLVEQFE
ncbi:MAG: SMC family ATPase [Candidatus Altiarchaeota archaeon]|nr:SMC family ATPase [Candidatus Altiarchaeota archaeon]